MIFSCVMIFFTPYSSGDCLGKNWEAFSMLDSKNLAGPKFALFDPPLRWLNHPVALCQTLPTQKTSVDSQMSRSICSCKKKTKGFGFAVKKNVFFRKQIFHLSESFLLKNGIQYLVFAGDLTANLPSLKNKTPTKKQNSSNNNQKNATKEKLENFLSRIFFRIFPFFLLYLRFLFIQRFFGSTTKRDMSARAN